VDDLFVDEDDRPEYVGVKMGFLGNKSTLIPMQIVSIHEGRQTLEVDYSRGVIEDGPTFDDEDAITPELEERVRNHYGLGSSQRSTNRGTYGDEDDVRVQRVEEELVAGTREREVGRMNVRKRVRTDREQVRVPRRREEVSIERIPVDEDRRQAFEAEIGEDEIRIPIVEEEIVVEKRLVVKEEIRVRKNVVEEEEVVEADVRKEEIDIEDTTERRDGAR
jgi:uncharacterized protein (TIGR02271 family)